MASQYRTAAVVFRRDLRLADHTALARAADFADKILPCFVFDPSQTDPDENEYFSATAFRFLLTSLDELGEQIAEQGGRLYRFSGAPEEILGRLIDDHGVEAVFVNRDYTPFSRERDGRIQSACAERKVAFHSGHDALLTRPGQVLTGSGSPYQTYTSFFKKASKETIPEPAGTPSPDWWTEDISFAEDDGYGWDLLPSLEPAGEEDLFRRGGRSEALEILQDLDRFETYQEDRDLPARDGGTTGLSAHHKFGTISIRESYHRIRKALGKDHTLIQELFWRDFFTQLAHFNPHVFGAAFNRQYEGVAWENDDDLFEAWKEGRTGVPIVDAGMRQLAQTGFLHNRVRMIVASYLTKDLHIDWRRGERHFARHLVDYDPAVNNGNWQWAASTGADAQPYFRIFNPWRQAERFDPEAEYIRRWVPELADLDPKTILKLQDRRPDDLDYPEPIVDHKERAARAKEMFQEAKG